jgi:two-component system, NarL family, invasion response regulator UvrY
MDPCIQVAIVDDSAAVRMSLRAMVKLDPQMNVVAEAENGSAAIAMVEEHRPDVVLMDITMPVLDGIEATRIITSKFPGTKVIVLSAQSVDSISADRALNAGACRFLTKGCSVEEILDAIEESSPEAKDAEDELFP